MTKQLNMWQKNNLLIGNDLAAKITASNNDFRAFVSIGSYLPSPGGGRRPSNILNAKNQDKIRFWLRKYEIHKDYIENMWDVSDNDLRNSSFRNEISSLDELETELGKYLEDFSQLGLTHDNPL
jgi:hypothetical protein